MNKFDDIIIGSGISGLTAAIVIAGSGRKVLLVEKSKQLGGSLKRFKHCGLYFDTGFHFSGGLREKGLMRQIFSFLKIRDELFNHVRPLTFKNHLSLIGYELTLPRGLDNFKELLQESFPKEADNITRFFEVFKDTFKRCSLESLDKIISTSFFEMIDSDYFSLQNVLDKYFTDATLKALISSCCVSFGVSPKKISFINFVRVAWYFYESVDTFDNGGNAIYNALMEKIQNLPITILRDVYPVEFKNIESRFCKNVVLSNGVEYEMQNCLFTIHPRLIMDIMPEEVLSGSIKERILAFEESNGFFCTYGKIKEGYNFPPAVFNDLLLLNSCDDINKYFEQPYPEEGSVCFLTNKQENNDTITFTAMETMYFEQVEKYSNSFIHKRQKEYYEMKKSKSKELLSRIAKVYSLPQNTLEEVCSATPLTFRDYLNSYNGSAYGISQIMGQYNIIGRIKLKNFYVTGQSSFLPGILGSMLSSIIVSKVMLGEELFLKTFK